MRVEDVTVVDVYLPSEQALKGPRRSIKDLPLMGCGPGGADIEDGVTYVNKIRDNSREKSHADSERMACLIDIDVMVDASRRNADAADYVESLPDAWIAIATAQELIVGAGDAGGYLRGFGYLEDFTEHRDFDVFVFRNLDVVIAALISFPDMGIA